MDNGRLAPFADTDGVLSVRSTELNFSMYSAKPDASRVRRLSSAGSIGAGTISVDKDASYDRLGAIPIDEVLSTGRADTPESM